jgi:hypothetical protein
METINMNALNALNATANANAATMFTEQCIKFSAIAGDESEDAARESSTLWQGRKIGKQARKNIMLSTPILLATEFDINRLDPAKLAILLNDEIAAYIRRVKLQRLEIGSSIELRFNFETMLNMLTAPATRTKKLVSSSSVKAMLLSSDYKNAVLAVIPQPKQEAWNRIFSREFAPLATADTPMLAFARSTVRDTVCVRCIEIASIMPLADNRLILEAVAELLADITPCELDDSI